MEKTIREKLEYNHKNTLRYEIDELKSACIGLYNSVNEWLMKTLKK